MTNDEKKARLSAALRDNLRRRKTLARAEAAQKAAADQAGDGQSRGEWPTGQEPDLPADDAADDQPVK